MDPTALFPKLHAADDPAERIVNEHQALRAELLQLPQHQRAVLICRYLLDLDEAETSAVLGIAPGTAKSRGHRGLGRLRSALGQAAVGVWWWAIGGVLIGGALMVFILRYLPADRRRVLGGDIGQGSTDQPRWMVETTG